MMAPVTVFSGNRPNLLYTSCGYKSRDFRKTGLSKMLFSTIKSGFYGIEILQDNQENYKTTSVPYQALLTH